MTQLYLAKWPNGSVSLIEAENETELFSELDSQCDPLSATIFKIKKSERLHLEFEMDKQGDESFIDVQVAEDTDKPSQLRNFSFKKDEFVRYLSRITKIPVNTLKKQPEYIATMKKKFDI